MSDEQQTDTAPPAPETPPDGGSGTPIPPPSGGTNPDTPPDDTGEPQTFDRAYVEELRRENAAARVRAKQADTLAAALVTSYAELTGRLADPTDLPFTDELLDDDGLVNEDKVRGAVEDLIKRKPHLATRRPTGDVGQGARPEAPEIGLAAMLRRGA